MAQRRSETVYRQALLAVYTSQRLNNLRSVPGILGLMPLGLRPNAGFVLHGAEVVESDRKWCVLYFIASFQVRDCKRTSGLGWVGLLEYGFQLMWLDTSLCLHLYIWSLR